MDARILLIIVATLGVTPALATPAPKAEKSTADGFFGLGKLHAVHLRVSRANWELMQPTYRAQIMRLGEGRLPPLPIDGPVPPVNVPARPKAPPIPGDRMPPNAWGIEFAYVTATFECDGQIMSNVALRMKGNASYELGAGVLKRPFKLDFDRYEDKQRFHGLRSLNLLNNAYDPSYVREALSCQLVRDAGVPAPRTAFALVSLTVDGLHDRVPLGLYTLAEEPDDRPFLKNHFGSSKGMLFKAEAMRGLPDLGRRVEPYADHFEFKANASADGAQRLLDLIRLIHDADDATFAREIPQRIDVDNVLRYLAVTGAIANLDSLLTTGHNYFLYDRPSDRRLNIISWDHNLSLGAFPVLTTDQQHDLSIARPWGGRHRLLERLLAIPAHNETYRGHLRRIVTETLSPARLAAHAEAMRPAVTAAKANPPRGPDPSQLPIGSGPAPEPIAFLARRAASIEAQLAGQIVGHSPPESGTAAPGVFPGCKSTPAVGNVNQLAFALLAHADRDRDFRLSPVEWDAAARSFHAAASTATPKGGFDWSAAARALDPLLAPYTNAGARYFPTPNAPADAAAKVPPALWAHALCRTADPDRSGHVTAAEFLTAAQHLFCPADKDQDGRLDERELAEALDDLGATALAP
jgi:hypothetical protein